ncbi:glycosyltransferase [Lutimonas zeaxanthinifaciens]|uniref:glycosyltransferase n=1 Tax=Lutimonas zeaxanthinifaciens TaxID=3060215 RepID=UPI00265CA6F4|nr:glycosyltransferase [Lutimonas sp. YSD2104]WKK64984.1 glycosyltransferase [Lutimonas sp. YSD2104]
MLLLITFCLIVLVQLYFHLFLFIKFSTYKRVFQKIPSVGVSVIICARNEAENLKKLLPLLATQEHDNFEIILINDGSEDDTAQIIQSFEKQCSKAAFTVKSVHISKKDTKGKKSALSQGISYADHDWILLTDADCVPVSNKWITLMTSDLDKQTEIVLGYGAYEKIERSFLNKLIRFETLLTGIQYFSYALAGKPYMGVGRNLAYKRSSFERVKGFSNHSEVKSGDDDLLVSEVADASNTQICVTEESITVSNPHTSYSGWIRQKRRHITTAGFYKKNTKFLLASFFLSQLSFYILFLALILDGKHLTTAILAFSIRFLFWYWNVSKAARILNEKDLVLFGPLYEISIIFMQLYIYLRNLASPPKHW